MKKNDFLMMAVTVILCLTVLGFGLACGGGGGGGGIRLPEGKVYLYEEGMENWLGSNYLEVDTRLDTQIVPLPANPENGCWWPGLFLFFNALGEDGLILNIHPDNPAEDITRVSVSLHPACLNFSQETWDFINQDPERNTFITLQIMSSLLGQGTGALLKATS
ncbi:MAG: hypothetical protein NC911_10855, partial [Candidatus Omnitrophica bacterium]|nr:hypothetical protein [Candidatus Omnitrophota bacterium]